MTWVLMIYWIIVICSSIAAQLLFFHYCRSIGIEPNPNKVEMFGRKLTLRAGIKELVAHHLAKNNFTEKQKITLRQFVQWEKWNERSFLLFPVLIILVIVFDIKPGSAKTNTQQISVSDTASIEETRNDFKKFYDEYNVEGMFVLYNPKKKKYTFYNKSLFHQQATPASTFNIINALVALEEGTIKDENSIIKWNGRKYNNPIARQDLDLKTAFKYNIDWYFWQLRLRTGGKKMKAWLNRIQYGDPPEDIDSIRITPLGIDSFWVVSGTLSITPAQQLEYIQRFYNEQLPFSKRSINIVKNLLFEKDTSGYKIFGKRGSYRLNGEKKYIGWFVGYLETKDDVYFFVNYIQSPDLHHPRIVDAQKDIAFRIFETLDPAKR